MATARSRYALRQNWHNKFILTNDIGNEGFSEARRDIYNGLITQTSMVL